MTACFKGRKRPLTLEDVESFRHVDLLTAKLEAFIHEDEVHIVTECPRIAGRSELFQRVKDFQVLADAEPVLTILAVARAD